jgi:hypothetical protein
MPRRQAWAAVVAQHFEQARQTRCAAPPSPERVGERLARRRAPPAKLLGSTVVRDLVMTSEANGDTARARLGGPRPAARAARAGDDHGPSVGRPPRRGRSRIGVVPAPCCHIIGVQLEDAVGWRFIEAQGLPGTLHVLVRTDMRAGARSRRAGSRALFSGSRAAWQPRTPGSPGHLGSGRAAHGHGHTGRSTPRSSRLDSVWKAQAAAGAAHPLGWKRSTRGARRAVDLCVLAAHGACHHGGALGVASRVLRVGLAHHHRASGVSPSTAGAHADH